MIDALTGTITRACEFDAFGKIVSDTNPNLIPFGFAGGLHDPDTGLTRFWR